MLAVGDTGLSGCLSWTCGHFCLSAGPITLSHFPPSFKKTGSSCTCCSQIGRLTEQCSGGLGMGVLSDLYRRLRGPRCPVDADRKRWIETRLLWLRDHFGSEPVRRDPLTPASPELPTSWDGSEDACLDLVERLCAFMGIRRDTLDVVFYDTEENPLLGLLPAYELSHSGPAGLFQSEGVGRFILGIDVRGLDDPRALVATVCHELGHVHLLGHGRLPREAQDHEPTTDLLTVFFGAGLFNANSAFQFSQWQDLVENRQGWSARRLGYLSEEEYGYALACYARLRGEASPAWARFLESNIRHFFDESLDFLERSRDATAQF